MLPTVKHVVRDGIYYMAAFGEKKTYLGRYAPNTLAMEGFDYTPKLEEEQQRLRVEVLDIHTKEVTVMYTDGDLTSEQQKMIDDLFVHVNNAEAEETKNAAL
jgi:hypothetical protein